MEYEYSRILKQQGQELTPQEIEEMGEKGWEEYFPKPEEQLNFIVTNDKVIGEYAHAYIFRRKKLA